MAEYTAPLLLYISPREFVWLMRLTATTRKGMHQRLFSLVGRAPAQ